MGEFNATRVDLARRRRGITKTELAKRVGVSTRILNLYETGAKSPSRETLERLGSALDFPVEFFEGPDIAEPETEGVSFRSLSSMTSKQRNQAVGSASIALILDDWIRAQFSLPMVDVPRLRDSDPESAAAEVRAAWGLGQKRIPNLIHLLEHHGIRVFSLVEECAEVDAFSFWRDGVPYVFLNTMKTPERSRMDAAHELGHLVLHFWGGPTGRQAETEAKAFASAFLMPAESVLADAPRSAAIPQIVQAKKRWNVSAMALAYRMHKVGLITDWQARSVYIEMRQLGYRTAEPEGSERETSQVLNKVLGTLRKEGTSMRGLAAALNVPVGELNRVVFHLAVAGVGDTNDRGASSAGADDRERASGHLRLV